jgi:predicted enzyme related to lactoylglutathione lyase
MAARPPDPVVHLELHTANLGRACDVYAAVCGWQIDRVDAYHALVWGGALSGGVVECGTRRAVWLPYVEVANVHAATEHARRRGAAVLLEPREGPTGRRSVVAVPDGAELAFWQPKPS